MKNIFISPSTQEHNIGVSPFTSEEVEMNAIVDILFPLLIKDGLFNVKRNDRNKDVYQAAADSNNFLADIHIAIHSNAGGGVGTEVFAYSPNSNSFRLAQALCNQIAPLSPGADRGIKFNPRLVEVGDTVHASAALIELGFHDNSKDAEWLASNHSMIAVALYKGICDYYGYKYLALTVAPAITPPVTSAETLDHDVNLVVWVRKSKVTEAIKSINSLGFYAEQFPLKLRRD